MNLTKSQIGSLGQGDDEYTKVEDEESEISTNRTDSTANTKSSKTKSKTAWERAPYMPNQFENRQKNQQKILENQQKQIKEQQRMIEELTYLQKQQLLQQQLTTNQIQTQIINNAGTVTPSTGIKNTVTDKMEAHISQLRQDLVAQIEEEKACLEEQAPQYTPGGSTSTARYVHQGVVPLLQGMYTRG